MNFHSLEFGLFFAMVVTAYYLLPFARRVPMLLAASLLFYLTFAAQNIYVLAGLIVSAYLTGFLIEHASSPQARKFWLVTALAVDLGLMAVFKYSPDVLGRSFGPIPIGLSFHAFQAMSYAVDIYRGRLPAERSFPVFALYIMFFPQIAAGPIERPGDMLPQFHKPHPFRYADVVAGLQLMLWGIFQKYVVADHLAWLVNSIYDNPAKPSGPVTAFGAVCFSFQIFCDFAGYSEIALGAAQVLGLRLTRNFNAPFHADSMAEYWKRWHISLSTWLRDYLYIPLGGSRHGEWMTYRNLTITMLLGGLWHGASWNFLIWGGYQGLLLSIERPFRKQRVDPGWNLLSVPRVVLTFGLAMIGWVFFRAADLRQSALVISQMFSGSAGHLLLQPWHIELALLSLGIAIAEEMTEWSEKLIAAPVPVFALSLAMMLFCTEIFGAIDSSIPFIYFQF
jgi:D-alanyl-lipoteichoic acid acyltransferase DltB (MBOAT superfamily)